MVWIATAIAAAASWVDVRRHEIPDGFPLALAACAVLAAVFGVSSWLGAALGGALGFALGSLFFALGAFGGGDAKLLAGVGACVGPGALAEALLPMAFAGGVLSLIALARGARELAYGPAIAAGLLVYGVRGHWALA